MPGIPPCSATKAITPPPLPLSGGHGVGEGVGASVGGRAVSVGIAVSIGGKLVAVGFLVGGIVAVGWLGESGVVRAAIVWTSGRAAEQALMSITTSKMRNTGIRTRGFFGIVISR